MLVVIMYRIKFLSTFFTFKFSPRSIPSFQTKLSGDKCFLFIVLSVFLLIIRFSGRFRLISFIFSRAVVNSIAL